jgi:hypothetical protein
MESYLGNQMNTRSDQTLRWEPFDDGEMWIVGAALWLWNPSWEKPRLAIASADDDAMGDWIYPSGEKVGGKGEPWPTHCCRPLAPPPPQSSTEFAG